MNDSSKATECPKCGSEELGEGKQSGHAAVTPAGGITSVPVIHTICSNCGYIIESYVKRASKFKKRY